MDHKSLRRRTEAGRQVVCPSPRLLLVACWGDAFPGALLPFCRPALSTVLTPRRHQNRGPRTYGFGQHDWIVLQP